MFYKNHLKRWLDAFLAGAALLVLSPLLGLLCLLIKLDSKGPVLFRQQRYGKEKKLFSILKFRTMYTDTPANVPTNELQDPEKFITRVGKILRKTSLDELPQLWNILVGDMALIGPRPALWNQYFLMECREKEGAADIRPGLSGWAQVNGRDILADDEAKKAAFDGEYARNLSFGFDCKCLWRTVLSVFRRDGFAEGVSVSRENLEKHKEE